ncbi:MAG: patatin-like phospholipase family protein [Paludibacteraceae bacterium]|nr:patatin-like phospholipase family protein [Paludibacteraceae bacterium]
MTLHDKKSVALVLGSGGARGLAHIGAIEALEERGYQITSVSGCSMGSIIAGMFCAGKLEEAKQWFLSIDKQRILQLTDFSITGNSLVKGKKIIKALQEIVPECKIESLPIPLTLVASDLLTTDEVVFRTGSLFEAIRASISIPLFFQPVQWQGRLLVDGGILNPLPLKQIQRTEGDILVAMNISGKDGLTIHQQSSDLLKLAQTMQQKRMPNMPKAIRQLGESVTNRLTAIDRAKRLSLQGTVNYVTMLDRMSDMQIQQSTLLALQLTPPDVLATMPQYAFNTFDFDKAETIIAEGYRLMNDALDSYEA